MIQYQHDAHIRVWEGIAFVRSEKAAQDKQARRDNYRGQLAHERRVFDGATEAYERTAPRETTKPGDRACSPVIPRTRGKRKNRRERIAARLARALA